MEGRKVKCGAAKAAAFLCMGMLVLPGFSREAEVTPETLFKDASEKLAEINSFSGNMAIEMEASGEIQEGQNTTMKINLDLDMEATKEPTAAYLKGTMGVNAMGMDISMEVENYTVPEGEGLASYTKVNDMWEKQMTDVESGITDAAVFGDLSEGAGDFELSENPVVVNEQECYELTGKFDVSKLAGILDSAGSAAGEMDDMLGDMEMDGAQVPVSICIYKESGYPALMSVDFTQAMEEAMKGSGEELEIGKFALQITYSSFDDIEEIKVPEEAKTATAQSESGTLGVDDVEDIIGSGTNNSASGNQSTIETSEAAPENGQGWQTYEISINGKKVKFPCKAADLQALGYTYDEDTDPEYIVNKGEYEYGYMVDKEGGTISVYFLNNTTKPLAIPECEIAGFGADEWFLEDSTVEIVFPGDIKIGSTLDEVLAAYGQPQDAYEGDLIISLYYYPSDNYMDGLDITIDKENNTVSEISIKKLG